MHEKPRISLSVHPKVMRYVVMGSRGLLALFGSLLDQRHGAIQNLLAGFEAIDVEATGKC